MVLLHNVQTNSFTATDNGNAGLLLGDGSSAVIQDSNINHNNTPLVNGNSGRKADIVAIFGSRLTFNDGNNIGFVSCDKRSYSRGDVKCNRRN